MKKVAGKIWRTGMLMLLMCSVRGQTLETMLKQIAALQGFIGVQQTGYQILGTGLQEIGTVKGGEYGSHQVYFASLRSVNPVVQTAANGSEMKEVEAMLDSQGAAARTRYANSGWLSVAEKETVVRLCDFLVGEGKKDIGALRVLLGEKEGAGLSMDDGNRLQEIGHWGEEIRELYRQLLKTVRETDWLIWRRQQASAENGLLQGIR